MASILCRIIHSQCKAILIIITAIELCFVLCLFYTLYGAVYQPEAHNSAQDKPIPKLLHNILPHNYLPVNSANSSVSVSFTHSLHRHTVIYSIVTLCTASRVQLLTKQGKVTGGAASHCIGLICMSPPYYNLLNAYHTAVLHPNTFRNLPQLPP